MNTELQTKPLSPSPKEDALAEQEVRHMLEQLKDDVLSAQSAMLINAMCNSTTGILQSFLAMTAASPEVTERLQTEISMTVEHLRNEGLKQTK